MRLKTTTLAAYVCECCGETFRRPADCGYRFCSRTCYHRWRTGRPQDHAKPIINRCQWCGEAFPSTIKPGARTRYCCRTCQAFAFGWRSEPRRLSPIEAAYLAGIVDGEGSITISDRTATRPASARPTIYLAIGNTHRPLLEWVQEVTGLGVIAPARHTGGNKPMYYWRLTSVQAAVVLHQIAPFMIEKRQRAQAAIHSQTERLAFGLNLRGYNLTA